MRRKKILNIYSLYNFGYIEDKIPPKLYDMLLSESDYAELKNPDMISGITNIDVAKHKFVVDTKNELINYAKKILNIYNSNFPGLQNVRVLTKDLPFYFGEPWFNFQRKGQYVPNHTHDGIYSYSLWLKIPKPCLFEFTYTNVIGNIAQHKIKLSSEDEGKIIFFPAKLPHIAYPFNNNDDVRIAVSGNIYLNSYDK